VEKLQTNGAGSWSGLLSKLRDNPALQWTFLLNSVDVGFGAGMSPRKEEAEAL
jgi:hypothetical protein